MASLQELIAQKDALEREIERTRQQDRSEAISKIRTLMEQYGLTTGDLAARAGAKAKAKAGKKVAAKYRDTATGDTWSGRGLQPKWLKAALSSGRKLSEFAL